MADPASFGADLGLVLLEATGHGSLVVDVTARVLRADRRAGAVLARAPEALPDTPLEEVVPGATPEWLARGEAPLEWDPGDGRWLRAVAVVLPDPTQRGVLLSDETERRRRTSELRFLHRAVDRLEALALAEHGAAAVAHELNNVLQSLVVLTGFEEREPSPRTARELRETATHAARLGRLLLDTGTPRRDAAAYCEPAEVLANLEPMLDCLLRHRHRLALEPTGPVPVPRAALERVVLNLAANARDATVHGGHTVLSTRRENDRAVLEVADEGEGMDDETRRRADQLAFTTKPDGTGLGLALVHRIAERYGGRVHLASTPGRGTTVRVELPQLTESGETSITTE
ncbi:MAG TPA: ATP-binding protein [Sandaracinaceae bacterium LLY-WYZ-13_1]|nr:ATP-binding protein [Sandaracinaceae bacterium LLY-WYZ-13_1]